MGDRIENLFALLAPLPAAERATILDRECGGDPELRDRVLALLRAHDRSGHFLDQSARGAAPAESEGSLVTGRYKLLEQIGEGGMGTVWVAEQIEPVKRKVALKLIKPGMDSRAVLARFEAERQALALMDHPGIAKVFDGGLTEAGRPFFAMEYVKGVPITEYCDVMRLDVRGRLRLFAQACQAVQHAHLKGIIHRDLKPSNILVAPYDGAPVPKVIDFGLAKAIHQPLTDLTIHTAHETVLGTPLYMSPEQAQLNNLDIDTRSDVYSLGVILYELLTGTTPFGAQQLRDAAWDEVRRFIREEEPPRPSTRLSSTDTLPSLAAFRQTEPARLTRQVRGELDWITMKALEKDRARRYGTAETLARDIERYLGDEPVEARPSSAGYRLRKFVKRHRLPVAAAACAAVALVAGIVGTTWGLLGARDSRRLAEVARDAEAGQRAEAVAQRDKAVAAEELAAERLVLVEAEQRRTLEEKGRAEANEKRALEEKRIADAVRRFLEYKLLGQADTSVQADALLKAGGVAAAADPNVTVRELLDRASVEMTPERTEANFAGQPLVQAALLQTLGDAYRGVGEPDAAVPYLQRAAMLRARHLGPEHADTLRTLNNLAGAYASLGRLPEAVRLQEQVRDAAERTLGPEHPFTLVALDNLAVSYMKLGKLGDAIRIQERVRDTELRLYGPDNDETLRTLCNLAATYNVAGRREEAARILEQAVAASERVLGADHPDTLTTLCTLGLVYTNVGRLEEGIRILERARDAAVKKFGADHPQTLRMVHNVAIAYLEAGRTAEATPILERAIETERRKFGANHPSTLTTLEALAECYRANGKADKAVALLEQIRDIEQKTLGPDHPDTLCTVNNLAAAYQTVGRIPEAIRLFELVGEAMTRKLGPAHPDTLSALENLTVAYGLGSQWDRSIPVLEELLRRREAIDREHPATIGAMASLGVHLCAARRLDRAIPLLEGAYRRGQPYPPLAWIGDALVDAYVAAGKTEEAARLTGEALAAARQQLPPESPPLASALVMAGKHLNDLKRYEESETLLREGVALREKLKDAVRPWQVASARSLLGGALLGQRKYAEAEPLLLAGAEGLRKDKDMMPAQARANVPAAIQRLVDLYEATERADEAARWRKEMEALLQ